MTQASNSYHGNPNLKPLGYQHDFSEEEIKEYVKSKKNLKTYTSNNLNDKNNLPSQKTLNFILSYSKSVKSTSKDKFLFSLN